MDKGDKVALKSTGSNGVSAELNFIGKGTFVEGNISTESSIRIDGKIKGSLICKNTLTIGDSGEIEGDVEATNAIVGGKIKGKVIIKEKLVLEAKSSLHGELKAKKLIIDEGAVFDGTSSMGTPVVEKTIHPQAVKNE
jgi:cytoskeletal protein CcmA (bactofilin family)